MCASAQEPWANIAELRLRNSVINYLYPKRLLWTVITLSIHHQITNGASLNICPNWSPWSRWNQNGSHESWKRFNIVGGKSLIYKTGWKCKKNWCGGNWLWEMEQNLCYLWNLSFGKKLFSRVLWKSIYQKSSDCGNCFLYNRLHGCQIWSSLYFWNSTGEKRLLAPTGALIVMMVYYISGSGSNFFRFSLSPLMQLMLQVSL